MKNIYVIGYPYIGYGVEIVRCKVLRENEHDIEYQRGRAKILAEKNRLRYRRTYVAARRVYVEYCKKLVKDAAIWEKRAERLLRQANQIPKNMGRSGIVSVEGIK